MHISVINVIKKLKPSRKSVLNSSQIYSSSRWKDFSLTSTQWKDLSWILFVSFLKNWICFHMWGKHSFKMKKNFLLKTISTGWRVFWYIMVFHRQDTILHMLKHLMVNGSILMMKGSMILTQKTLDRNALEV